MIFIGNKGFICKRFANIFLKYGEKAKVICRDYVDSLRTKINYYFLQDAGVSSNFTRSKDYYNVKLL